MSNYDYMNNIIKTFSGDKRTVTIPKIYLELTEDYPTAAFLNQLIYWSDKSKRKDGYFYKKYEDWNEEILLSNYQIRRITKTLEDMGFITTSLKKANGVPTKHYKVNMNNIQNAIVNKLNNGNLINLTIESEETEQSLDCEETEQSLTVKYTNNHNNINTDTDAFKNAIGNPPNVNNVKDKVPYKEVIEYLNEKTGKKFNYTAKGNRKFISARYNEGNSLDDFKYVIDVKVADWNNDKHMRTYLKPETLFSGSNFEKYKNETIEEVNERNQYWQNKNNNFNSYNNSSSWIYEELEKEKSEK